MLIISKKIEQHNLIFFFRKHKSILPSGLLVRPCVIISSKKPYRNICEVSAAMKKLTALVFSLILCILLIGCSKTVSLQLPFEASEIASVEIFHFIDPTDAEKKVITRQDDINDVFSVFQGLSLKEQKAEPAAGAACTGFRFFLSDGTTYEILYWSVAVKSGRICTSETEQSLFTSADIEANWNQYDYEAVPAAESELPLLS